MTAERTLIVAEPRMDAALAELVHRTCAFSGVEQRVWNGVERLDDLAGRAALAIGVLPLGARRIPGELAALVTEQLPGLPLVLLAQERLVRPLISLDEGRVSLLEAPLEPTLLASCARTLLTEATPAQAGWGAAAPAEGTAVDRREYRVGRCWIGALDCNGGAADWSQRVLPWVQVTPDDPREAALAVLLARVEADGRPAWRRGEGEVVEGPIAALELRAGGDRPEWVFPALASGTPEPAAAVGLYSSWRLPAWTALGPAASRVVAASGDLVVAMAPAVGWVDSVRREAGAGGPALLDVLEAELQRSPAPFSCLAVELG
jgi:hypothetical protein